MVDSLTAADAIALLKGLSAAEIAELDKLLLSGDAPIWLPQQRRKKRHFTQKQTYCSMEARWRRENRFATRTRTNQPAALDHFRREAVQLIGIEERMTAIPGTRKGYNSRDGLWRLPNGKGV